MQMNSVMMLTFSCRGVWSEPHLSRHLVSSFCSSLDKRLLALKKNRKSQQLLHLVFHLASSVAILQYEALVLKTLPANNICRAIKVGE